MQNKLKASDHSMFGGFCEAVFLLSVVSAPYWPMKAETTRGAFLGLASHIIVASIALGLASVSSKKGKMTNFRVDK
jgi:hypothetical protein